MVRPARSGVAGCPGGCIWKRRQVQRHVFRSRHLTNPVLLQAWPLGVEGSRVKFSQWPAKGAVLRLTPHTHGAAPVQGWGRKGHGRWGGKGGGLGPWSPLPPPVHVKNLKICGPSALTQILYMNPRPNSLHELVFLCETDIPRSSCKEFGRPFWRTQIRHSDAG